MDFFFVLIGFVISLSYLEKIRSFRSSFVFLIRRFDRIWPLHAFILFCFIMIILVKTVASQAGLYSPITEYTESQIALYALENLMLVHAFRNETNFWLNFPSWSISAEFWAYTSFALLCLLPRRSLPFFICDYFNIKRGDNWCY